MSEQMTRQKFLAAYAGALIERYPWAREPGKLERFMVSCADTLAGGGSWHHVGDAVTSAWRAVGGKGTPSLKALRALPVEGAAT